jgi:hypothetical protein
MIVFLLLNFYKLGEATGHLCKLCDSISSPVNWNYVGIKDPPVIKTDT